MVSAELPFISHPCCSCYLDKEQSLPNFSIYFTFAVLKKCSSGITNISVYLINSKEQGNVLTQQQQGGSPFQGPITKVAMKEKTSARINVFCKTDLQ